jgi:hypothetical protein
MLASVVEHFMRIEVLADQEHTRRRKAEPAFRQDSRVDADERWSIARKGLLDRLNAYWTNDPTEYDDGDFFVGEDWSGNRVLHVVVMRWEVLTTDFLQECEGFLVSPFDEFLITIGKSMPAVEDMFELVVTSQRSYVRFYRKGAEETRAVIRAHPRYGAIKALLG